MHYFSFLFNTKFRQVLLLPPFLFVLTQAKAQEQEQEKRFEIYGYIKTDVGYNFNQIDPNWFDVIRVTKLPRYKDQFAPDGKIFFGVRQTRIGFNNWLPTSLGQLKANFEFDLFGSGPNVGQTTFHLRKAYVQLGRFTFGQNESPFTDVDVNPNTLDFGGPPSRPWVRSIQVRYMQETKNNRWAIALEQPGATADEGIYADRIELQNVRPEFKVPDLTAQYRRIVKSGYIELAGVAKWIRWEDTGNNPTDLSGNAAGWGFYLSSTQKLGRQTLFKGQFVYGRGIEGYLTDAAFDIGIKNNFANPTTPVLGVALPVIGGMAFLEHNWSSKWSSTMGYSGVHIYNSEAQAGNAFKNGSYGIFNLQYRPVSPFMAGVELQWGQRKNFNDGFTSSAVKVQFSCKYNFSQPVFEQVNK